MHNSAISMTASCAVAHIAEVRIMDILLLEWNCIDFNDKQITSIPRSKIGVDDNMTS